MFRDRTDAGRRLAEVIDDHDVEADVALAIPRGGLPVGRAVADAMGIPLDVVVARKLGAPDNSELAIGSVASDGSAWINEELVARLDVPETYLEAERRRQAEAAREKLQRYRRPGETAPVAGRTVLVVDDGMATGATAIACVRQVLAAGAERVVVAVPVAPPDTVDRLLGEAHEVISVETPPHFGAVGQFYHSFRQVTDEEALSYLDAGG